jgi:hypothetical protein
MSRLTQSFEQGYVIAGPGTQLMRDFRQWCASHRQPLIYGKRQGQSTHIEMDLLFVPNEQHLNACSQEKIRTIYDYVARPGSHYDTSATNSYISGIANDQAEQVIRAFLAIFKQNQGIDAVIPTFTPRSDSPTYARMKEAKQKKYIVTHGIKDAFPIRWSLFCMSSALPYIQIEEQRKGHAKVEVKLAKGQTFTPTVAQHIKLATRQLGILDDDHTVAEIRRNQGRFYRLDDRSVSMLRTIPAATAIFFAEIIVRELTEAGYFDRLKTT